MDVSVRDWMIIIGGLLIVAVLLDGYRRMRNDPRRVKMSLRDVPGGGPGEEDFTRHELPNGGARVIGRTDQEDDTWSEDEDPPLVTETVAETSSAAKAAELEQPTEHPHEERDPPGFFASRQPQENLDLLDGITATDDFASTAEKAGVAGSTTAPSDIEPEVFMLHVVARDEAGFNGEDILQVLLAFEMRFGEMDFFHRHEQAAGRGAILFSVASMMQPGVFDIDGMATFQTRGLSFFASFPGVGDMHDAFELMLETAQGVADHLGGDLLDDTRSVATRQTLEHMRQRLRDLERRMLTKARR